MPQKVRKAVIPAAGLGTRFLPVTSAVPKPLLPVIDKPLIYYAVAEAAAAGIHEIAMVLSPGFEAVADYFSPNGALEKALEERGDTERLAMLHKIHGLAEVTVIEQVLTGRFADGLGNVQNVPDRIDFDPFPWQSMAVWILTQMKRWGYIEGSVDYQQIARDVFLASEARTVMNELGYDAPEETSHNYQIMGKTFDYTDPEGYLASFDIRRS